MFKDRRADSWYRWDFVQMSSHELVGYDVDGWKILARNIHAAEALVAHINKFSV